MTTIEAELTAAGMSLFTVQDARDYDQPLPANQTAWHGNTVIDNSPFISDGHILIRKNLLPVPLLRDLASMPSKTYFDKRDVQEDQAIALVQDAKDAELVAYLTDSTRDVNAAVYATTGKRPKVGVFDLRYTNYLYDLTRPGDVVKMQSRPDLHGSALSVYREGVLMVVIMSLFMAQSWKQAIRGFMKERGTR